MFRVHPKFTQPFEPRGFRIFFPAVLSATKLTLNWTTPLSQTGLFIVDLEGANAETRSLALGGSGA